VGLSRAAAQKKQLRQYSKGMLQRVGMAQALINDPEVVFLDEPMSGLDPMARYQMREIILSLKQQGKTIFFNSHVLSDVELICDRIGILAKGELICCGNLDTLLGTADLYRVTGYGGAIATLKDWIEDLEVENQHWNGHLNQDRNPQEFLTQLSQIEGTLIGMNLAKPSLEEFFVQQLRQRGLEVSQ